VGLFFLFIAASVFCVEMTQWILDKTPKPVMHANAVLGSVFLGLQTFFFGLLAELIIRMRRK